MIQWIRTLPHALLFHVTFFLNFYVAVDAFVVSVIVVVVVIVVIFAVVVVIVQI